MIVGRRGSVGEPTDKEEEGRAEEGSGVAVTQAWGKGRKEIRAEVLTE